MKQIRLVRVVAAMILGLFGATAQACQSGSGPSSAGASPSPTSSAASSSAVAVKAVIQKANQEQQQGTDQSKQSNPKNQAASSNP